MRTMLALALALLSTPAQAATQRVWISEFATTRQEAQAPFAVLPATTKQQFDITTGVKSSLPFKSTTRYIRIICEVQCAISGSETATTGATLLPALKPEYFGVTGGSTLSVIAAP
jgi:hypothetical protein